MAFGAAPTITSLGNRTVRFSGAGFNLAKTAKGTITASTGAGDAKLPASFPALNADEILVVAHQVGAGGLVPLLITKDSGPFATITITNPDAANTTGDLEIYVQAIHSLFK